MKILEEITYKGKIWVYTFHLPLSFLSQYIYRLLSISISQFSHSFSLCLSLSLFFFITLSWNKNSEKNLLFLFFLIFLEVYIVWFYRMSCFNLCQNLPLNVFVNITSWEKERYLYRWIDRVVKREMERKGKRKWGSKIDLSYQEAFLLKK